MHGRPDRSMRGIPPRDVYELEPLEPRLLLSGIPIDLGPTPDLMGFIQNKLNDYANELVVGHYTEEYDVTNDDVDLSVANEVVSATASNLTVTYSPASGFASEGFSFPVIHANLSTGPPGSEHNVIDASGSGLVLLAGTGVAGGVSVTFF